MRNLSLGLVACLACAVGAVAQVPGSWTQADIEPVHRFAPRSALLGEPRFSPDGRYAFLGSRDGWIAKYDLVRLAMVAEVRAGLGLAALAVSTDGRWVVAATSQPPAVVVLNQDLQPVRTHATRTLDGNAGLSAAAVLVGQDCSSFLVTFTQGMELWEISYDPRAEPIFDGLVHDYRSGEGIATPGFLNVRRTRLDDPLDDILRDPGCRHALGVTRATGDAGRAVQVVNLDIRRRIATIALPGVPDPASAVAFSSNGRAVLAMANRTDSVVHVLDTKAWKLVKNIDIPGPAAVLRSHPSDPRVWVGTGAGPVNAAGLAFIDKATLELSIGAGTP